MIIVKLITTLFIQLDFWNNVKNFVLSPFNDQRIEVFVVMFLIPFIVNVRKQTPLKGKFSVKFNKNLLIIYFLFFLLHFRY